MLRSVLAHGPQPYLARRGDTQAVKAGAVGEIIGKIMRGQ